MTQKTKNGRPTNYMVVVHNGPWKKVPGSLLNLNFHDVAAVNLDKNMRYIFDHESREWPMPETSRPFFKRHHDYKYVSKKEFVKILLGGLPYIQEFHAEDTVKKET